MESRGPLGQNLDINSEPLKKLVLPGKVFGHKGKYPVVKGGLWLLQQIPRSIGRVWSQWGNSYANYRSLRSKDNYFPDDNPEPKEEFTTSERNWEFSRIAVSNPSLLGDIKNMKEVCLCLCVWRIYLSHCLVQSTNTEVQSTNSTNKPRYWVHKSSIGVYSKWFTKQKLMSITHTYFTTPLINLWSVPVTTCQPAVSAASSASYSFFSPVY